MRLPRLTTMTAVAALTPVLVVVPIPMSDAVPQPTPVETSQQVAPLVEPGSAAVGDGDVVSGRDAALVHVEAPEAAAHGQPVVLGASAPHAVPAELAVVGVTWRRDGGDALAVQYRTRTDTGWGDWQAVDADADGDPGAAPGTGPADARAGSDPIVVTGAHEVQARLLGAPGGAPADPELTVIDPGSSPADATTDVIAPGAAHAAAARPYIRSRAAWGADESLRKQSPSYGVVKGVIVHHTAGTNNYSQSQVPAVLRGIYAFHVKDRGWNDIGYNALVDKWGRLWEGRAGGLSRSTIGAQASGFNEVTAGVSVMGDYRYAKPGSQVINALGNYIAWKASVHRFNPQGYFWHKGKRYRAVSGHRDVGNTSCPGQYIYSRLPEIASRARRLAGSTGSSGGNMTGGSDPAPAPAPAPAPSGAAAQRSAAVGFNAALLRGTTGALMSVSPAAATGISFANRASSADWRGYDIVVPSADLDGDRATDVVARRSDNGALYLAKGSAGGIGTPRYLGPGWGVMSHIVAPGDFNGDGKADIIAVHRSTARLLLYPGNGRGQLGRAVVISPRFVGVSKLVAPGDWDGDRKADLIGVTAGGRGILYRGNGRGGFLPSQPLATSLAPYRTLVGLTGTKSLLGVDAAGNGWLVRRHGTSTMRATRVAPHFRGLTVFAG